jgi:polyisoprenoid-binding protein YceI
MINKPVIILFFVMLHFATYAQQTYHLDIKKSKVLWDNRKTMGGHHGYMLFNSGSLNLSADEQTGNGFFNINMNSMSATDNTAAKNAGVNKKLREENYFSIDKYPAAIMTVKQIVRVGQSTTYKITGDLNIKGTTNSIEFTARLLKIGTTITATATTTIDRLKWHIDMQSPNKPWDLLGAVQNKLIADEILINLNLVFVKTE